MTHSKDEGLRLAILGAFPFPLPQGSQIFMQEQTRALIRSGDQATVLTYGRGIGAPPEDLNCFPTPRWSTPRSMRSGPHPGKPLADTMLWRAYLQAASRNAFDCALAHNAEAAGIALAARPWTRVPVVYVAHTILSEELSAYGSSRWRHRLDQIGGRLDRLIAQRADAVVTLCEDGLRALTPHSRGPITMIPPGHTVETHPSSSAIAEVCAEYQLKPDEYILYSGNLDGYQELKVLAQAAERLSKGSPPVVVATHDSERAANASDALRRTLRIIAVPEFSVMRALIHGARCLVLPRNRRGGFPIKLLNYMEAARPIVAMEGIAEGLRDGVSARLLSHPADPARLAEALSELNHDPELRKRLGGGARTQLVAEHSWESISLQWRSFLGSVKP
ncbi:MAG: glycosyltransferase family 4 protein [Myxococcota bacterium]|nr:glycosyltransferase family 4 protein [Myxococcota bacterium]